MEKVEFKLSPEAFGRLQETIVALELRGIDPDTAVRNACALIGYWPKAYTETILVVDYGLSGLVWPFQEVAAA